MQEADNLMSAVPPIAQSVTVVAGAVLDSPHWHLPSRIGARQGITTDSRPARLNPLNDTVDSKSPRTDT